MKFTKIKKLLSLCMLCVGMVAGNASAATCDMDSTSSEASLQDIFDGITTGGSSSVTANTDCLADANDSIWSVSGSGLSGLTMIIEIAGQSGTNTFGIYDTTDSSNKVELFDGAAGAGSQVVMSIKSDGSVVLNVNNDTGIDFSGNSFGYYMGINNGTFFYSDTSLNGDLFDHMLAYQGTGDEIQVGNNAAGLWSSNEYILAWEDLVFKDSDKDYNDMVLIVESVSPVPVPAAVWLFGSGLLGLVGIARRKKA